jgi:signal transduction histidine kinase
MRPDDGEVRARCDDAGRLIAADEPLLALQNACGGQLGEPVAIPELAFHVATSRRIGMHVSRPFSAFDGERVTRAWAEVTPVLRTGGNGFDIRITGWRAEVGENEGSPGSSEPDEPDLTLAEATVLTDEGLHVRSLDYDAFDLAGLACAIEREPQAPLYRHFSSPLLTNISDPHWRLLDGATVSVVGSEREWHVTVRRRSRGSRDTGLTVSLRAETALARPAAPPAEPSQPLFGARLTPALIEPARRIVATADTIQQRLAGPLDDEYTAYAADIALAGRHLLGLIEDVAQLEEIEAEGFEITSTAIDLGKIARDAAAMLEGRARERDITIVAPQEGETLRAEGEERRVLQIVLNLLGNALRYSPEESQVWLRLDRREGRALITVADQGRGLDEEEQQRAFDKFERLGRHGDGGSGLGLYISRRLAHAMGGELTIDSARGQGARFTLVLPLRKG